MGKGIINSPELYESTNIPEAQKERLRVSGKNLSIGIDYDVIDITYPTTTTELFVYSLAASTVRSIKLTYLTASKKDLSKVEVL